MDHRLGTLQVENVGKSKWFWLPPSLILRGIRRFYADTKIIFAPGKCLSHKYQPVLVLHITMKLKSRHNIRKNDYKIMKNGEGSFLWLVLEVFHNRCSTKEDSDKVIVVMPWFSDPSLPFRVHSQCKGAMAYYHHYQERSHQLCNAATSTGMKKKQLSRVSGQGGGGWDR